MKFHNFTQGLEEVFPLTEPQQKSLGEVGEPEIARLYYLKNNIFRGVNKLKNKALLEVEKLQQEKLVEKERRKAKLINLAKQMDKNGKEIKELFFAQQIQIVNIKK